MATSCSILRAMLSLLVASQTELQQIVPSVDVSTTSSISFTPDASVGPNGDI